MIAFGPVPSRRLGRSLGINNTPPRTCSYACIYCQLGRTQAMRVERSLFFEPEQIAMAVRDQLERARAAGECADYATFVSDGEPTLTTISGSTCGACSPSLRHRPALRRNATVSLGEYYCLTMHPRTRPRLMTM